MLDLQHYVNTDGPVSVINVVAGRGGSDLNYFINYGNPSTFQVSTDKSVKF